MTKFIQAICPKCGYEGTAMIVEYSDGRRIVFDACPKCGIKCTNIKEITK